MKYGASYNIYVVMGDGQFLEEVGAPEENTEIAVVGNDLKKIEQYLTETDSDLAPYVVANHEFIGKSIYELGGKVVSVVCFDDDDVQVVLAVIFEDPELPKIIE